MMRCTVLRLCQQQHISFNSGGSATGLLTGWAQQDGSLLELADGTIVMPFAHKDKGYGQRALFSYDNGSDNRMNSCVFLAPPKREPPPPQSATRCPLMADKTETAAGRHGPLTSTRSTRAGCTAAPQVFISD